MVLRPYPPTGMEQELRMMMLRCESWVSSFTTSDSTSMPRIVYFFLSSYSWVIMLSKLLSVSLLRCPAP